MHERRYHTPSPAQADFDSSAFSPGSFPKKNVLACGDSFCLFGHGGDIVSSASHPQGWFVGDTRFLSGFELRIRGESPRFLGSHPSSDNSELRIELSFNPELQGSAGAQARNLIHVERRWVLLGTRLAHRATLHNSSSREVALSVSLRFGSDFADLFEVRGFTRQRRGLTLTSEVTRRTVRLGYRGLDARLRTTLIEFSPTPGKITAHVAEFSITLGPDQTVAIEAEANAETIAHQTASRREAARVGFDATLAQRREKLRELASDCAKITTANESLNRLLEASMADLAMLSTRTDSGWRTSAGIPWYAALFGRDSLLTAFAMQPINPRLTEGTLRALAALQGKRVDKGNEEEPGKIVHEVRTGEMAGLGEVPFGRYYGSVDGTPLFLLLLGRHVAATGDLALAEELWPNVERALDWIGRFGDSDGDGYVEYRPETPRGLINQGWKDSPDSISHADGNLAKPPIALCEVQAYVYGAYVSIADIAARLHRSALSAELGERAAALRAAFQRDFWLEKEKTVALALDGNKQPCRVMSSNAAHCLALGLLDADQAEALGERLMAEEMFSGWGIRTLAAGERRYDPTSYHNGSVWPHDNAIALLGLKRSGQHRRALALAQGLLEASECLSGSLPELFCGFPREANMGPIPYPVACHPQAWSAASVYLVITAMLGLELDARGERLMLASPLMPPWLDWLRIDRMAAGKAATVSFVARRLACGERAQIEVVDKPPRLAIEIRD